jgi:hypothetical protein
MKQTTLLVFVLLLIGCKTKQSIVVLTDLRDSTRIEYITSVRGVKQIVRQQERTERVLISSEKRTSVVELKTGLKQAVSDNKKVVAVVKSDNAVKKVEVRKDAAVEKKQIQSVIVKSRKLPNTIKWIAILVIALTVGWIVIKKKIPFI